MKTSLVYTPSSTFILAGDKGYFFAISIIILADYHRLERQRAPRCEHLGATVFLIQILRLDFLKAKGETPCIFLNAVEKWEWFTKPTCLAISSTDRSVVSSNSLDF